MRNNWELKNQRNLFHQKLIDLLKDNKSLSDVWIVSHQIIPINTTSNTVNSNTLLSLKYKYLTPENELTISNQVSFNADKSIKQEPNIKHRKDDDELIKSLTSNNFSLPIDETRLRHLVSVEANAKTTRSSSSKTHISTLHAFNKSGQVSIPLIIFPQNELKPNINQSLVKNTCSIDETLTGELNDVRFLLNWLKLFVLQRRGGLSNATEMDEMNERSKVVSQPLILLVNSFIHKKLIDNCCNLNALRELVDLCNDQNIHLLFYPLESEEDFFSKNAFLKFTDTWTKTLNEYSMRTNPYSQLSFIYIYKQVLRTIMSNHIDVVKECFSNLLLKLYPLPFKLVDFNLKSEPADVECDTLANEDNNNDFYEEDEFFQNGQAFNNSLSVTQPSTVSYPKLTDQETTEIIEWIDGMSRVGSLCIKYTYLRELYLKYRQSSTSKPVYKEILAGEKLWIDFCKKNKEKFKYEYSFGLEENDYMSRWLDTDYWRLAYFNYLNTQCQVNTNESLWTFDIIQFPYSSTNFLLKAPEKDYQQRPKNTKQRISVIFAFNAAGDYLQPFIVYPLNFKESNNGQQDGQKHECFAPNGYVTCRVFDKWLTQLFLPYLNQTSNVNQDILLCYCAKLAVFDVTNYKLCRSDNNRIHPFAITTGENLLPFNLLFQKNLRNRQIDLFLDSWRKCTTKLNLSYQFRCSTKQEFFNVFMNTFQNCIDEIGNIGTCSGMELVETTSADSSSLNEFKKKMTQSFEFAQLWPISIESFKESYDKIGEKLKSNENNVENKESIKDVYIIMKGIIESSEKKEVKSKDETSVKETKISESINIPSVVTELPKANVKSRLVVKSSGKSLNNIINQRLQAIKPSLRTEDSKLLPASTKQCEPSKNTKSNDAITLADFILQNQTLQSKIKQVIREALFDEMNISAKSTVAARRIDEIKGEKLHKLLIKNLVSIILTDVTNEDEQNSVVNKTHLINKHKHIIRDVLSMILSDLNF